MKNINDKDKNQCIIDNVILSDRALKVLIKDVKMRIVFFDKYKVDDMKKEFEEFLKILETKLNKKI